MHTTKNTHYIQLHGLGKFVSKPVYLKLYIITFILYNKQKMWEMQKTNKTPTEHHFTVRSNHTCDSVNAI